MTGGVAILQSHNLGLSGISMSKNSRLKKVLIIAYCWGTRIPGLAKYLPEFGWQPIILTAPVSEKSDLQCRVIETGYYDILGSLKKLLRVNPAEDIRREVKKRLGVTSKKTAVDFFLTLCGALINYPDSERGWNPFAVNVGSKLLQKENIDAIISSSSPVTSHLIAKELKIKYKIPWIADLRDLWSQNHNYHYGRLRKFLDRRLELKTLSVADALVTVSPPLAEQLRTLHKREIVYTITNGFDPAEVNTPPANLRAKFTIIYTGTIFTGKQDPSKLFAALRDLISEGTMDPNDVKVIFYGDKEEWLAREVEEYGLSSIVELHGRVPQQIAIKKQRESQILLLLNWEDQEQKGLYSLKVFEYLAAQRPILVVGGWSSHEVVDETNAGVHCSTVEDVKDILRELYSEYKSKGEIGYRGNIEKINKYSYREMARKFVEVLDYISQERKNV